MIDAEWLDAAPEGFGSALSFFSDAACRFYLPAYLVADLAGRLSKVDPLDYLVSGFGDMTLDQPLRLWPRVRTSQTILAKQRWSGLTQAQAMAVVRYLEWRAASIDADAAFVSQALKNFWYERAAKAL